MGRLQHRGTAGIAFILSLGVVLGGCGKPNLGASPAEKVCDREAYVRDSFQYRPEEGETALSLKEGQPSSSVIEGYFGKFYDADWLRAITRASVLNTIAFIEKTGAHVYRSDPLTPRSRRSFASGAALPADLAREWLQAVKLVPGDSCGILTGLYLGSSTHDLPSLRSEAAIVIREDASRWILVHEFMHHNFKTQAAERGYDDDRSRGLQKSLLASIGELKERSTSPSREYVAKLASLFQRLIDVSDALVVQYEFEEVAVEAILQESYERGELGYVPPSAYANATWYIEHSRKNAQAMYESMGTLYAELVQLTAQYEMADERKAIERFPVLRDQRMAQLDEVLTNRRLGRSRGPGPEAGANPGGFGSRFAAGIDAVPGVGYAPCVDARNADRDMLAIVEGLRKTKH